MKKNIVIWLNIIFLILICYNQYSFAHDCKRHCILHAPKYNRVFIKGNTSHLPIQIHSNIAKIKYPNRIIFKGNVSLKQGNSQFMANKMQIYQKKKDKNSIPIRILDAVGNVQYDDPHIMLKAKKVHVNINNKDAELLDATYQLVNSLGHGKADTIKWRGNNRYIILENASFTSCLSQYNSWAIIGEKIIQDNKKEIVEIWNAKFKIGNVPIFYIPYLTIPIGNKRRSGFLIPNIQYTNNQRLQVNIPYYWNIAPQLDMTITPHYISRRGLQLQSELHYLTRFGSGLISLDYLFFDKKYNFKRYFLYWQHTGTYKNHWSFNIHLSKISDLNYFNDFNSKFYHINHDDDHNRFKVSYKNAYINTSFSSKCFHTLDINNKKNVYCAIPKISVHLHQHAATYPFNAKLYIQAIQFIHQNPAIPRTIRFHIEPTCNFLLSNNWGSINTEIKLFLTHYNQKNINYNNSNYHSNSNIYVFKKSINRILPQFKIDGRLILERKIHWGEKYLQILEPRVQYFYIPYQDQHNIYPYDCTVLRNDYTNLFHGRIYSGLDRIVSANKLVNGITTNIYDNRGREIFNFSIGKMYDFHSSPMNDLKDNTTWVSEAYWNIGHKWSIQGDIQYNPRLYKCVQGDAVLEYFNDTKHRVQLSYNYIQPKYKNNIFYNGSLLNHDIYPKSISQLGGAINWNVGDVWSVLGSYYYDLKNKKFIKNFLGIQYSSCCYSMRFGYERTLNRISMNNNSSNITYNNKLSFNIELRGLNTNV